MPVVWFRGDDSSRLCRHEHLSLWVGHAAGIGSVRVGFAPRVAGDRHIHQARVSGVLQITLEDAVLDQHGALAFVAFIII